LLPALAIAGPRGGAAGEPSAAESSTKRERDFLVAGLRVTPKTWDKAHNFALLEKYARDAARQGASLVVTCEGFLDGYASNPSYAPDVTHQRLLDVSEPLDGPWLERVRKLAMDLKIHLSVGFAERADDKCLNSVVLFSPQGERLLHYSKTHTKNEPFTTRGDKFPVVQTGVGRIGSLICYDRRFPEVPRILALKGAEILLIPSYGHDDERNEALLMARSWENSVWVVFVRQNQVLIINPSARIIARDKGEGDELVLGRIDLDGEQGVENIKDRRSPEVYRELSELQYRDE
jgi:predicted amidohydrolase